MFLIIAQLSKYHLGLCAISVFSGVVQGLPEMLFIPHELPSTAFSVTPRPDPQTSIVHRRIVQRQPQSNTRLSWRGIQKRGVLVRRHLPAYQRLLEYVHALRDGGMDPAQLPQQLRHLRRSRVVAERPRRVHPVPGLVQRRQPVASVLLLQLPALLDGVRLRDGRRKSTDWCGDWGENLRE